MTEEQFKVIVRAFFPNDVFVRDELVCGPIINWYHDGHLVGVWSPEEQFWDVWCNCTTQEQMVTYINQELL